MLPAEVMMTEAIGPYSTATDMLAALRAKQISSLELTNLLLTRIEERDGPLNAIPVRTPDHAREAARNADAALAQGEWRALLGLPITLKESTQTAGLPQSAGLPAFKDHRPTSDGPLAASVFAAGACLLGKTNISEALSDWQANSTIYGRTNNPWDLARTPGGSTGGGGAALAAGLTPLEIGSDIGGSIRVPAAYCGVYGHRPSETAIPRAGGFPRADFPNPAGIMAVQGPLARSAVDLELLFDVIAGPALGEDAGWRLALPPARHDRLRDFRVAVMPTPPWVRPSQDMQGKVDELEQFLGRQGARVTEAMPELDFDRYLRDYLCLLMVQMSVARSREQRETRAKTLAVSQNFMFAALAPGLTLDAAGLIVLLKRREEARAAWRRFFQDFDVLIGPTILDVAFPHQVGSFETRILLVDDERVPYYSNIIYPMWAIFAGQPATAFPAGLSREGLPLGLQAIGPYLEDRTPLRFAQLLEREWQAFQRPPGY